MKKILAILAILTMALGIAKPVQIFASNPFDASFPIDIPIAK